MSTETRLTMEDHKKAQKEVAFIVGTLSKTIIDVVGTGSSIVGRIAGVAASKKMPLYFESPDLKSIVEGIQQYLEGGFEMTAEIGDDITELNFSRCALREICSMEDIPLGGNLCGLFHDYLNGMINELTGKKSRVKILGTGDTCVVQHTLVSK